MKNFVFTLLCIFLFLCYLFYAIFANMFIKKGTMTEELKNDIFINSPFAI